MVGSVVRNFKFLRHVLDSHSFVSSRKVGYQANLDLEINESLGVGKVGIAEELSLEYTLDAVNIVSVIKVFEF